MQNFIKKAKICSSTNDSTSQNMKENIEFNSTICDINNNMKIKNFNSIETEDNNDKEISFESYGDKEYELCLKKALKEALDENEQVI